MNLAEPTPPTAPIRVTPDGHSPAAWAPRIEAATRLELSEVCDLIGSRDHGARLLVLAAHPDDETIGAGRLISEWVRTIGPATTVLATNGEACVDHVTVRPPDLGTRRQREWRQAVDLLGATDVRALELTDGQLEASQDRLEAALRGVVSDLLDLTSPGSLVLAAPYSQDPHPDHRAAGRAVRSVAMQLGLPYLSYPLWLTFWTSPEDFGPEPLWRLRVTPEADRARERALDCFVTQFRPIGPGLDPVVPAELLDHHREQLLIYEAGR